MIYRIKKLLLFLGLFFCGGRFTFFLTEREDYINEVFSYKIPLADLIFFILFLIIFFENPAYRLYGIKKNRFYFLLQFMYITSILLSIVNASNKIVVIKDLLQIFLYTFMLSIIAMDIDFDFIFKSIFSASIIHFFIVSVSYFLKSQSFQYGFFDHPNQLAVFVAMTLPLGFYMRGRIHISILILFFITGAIALYIAQKRGATIGALAGLVFSFILMRGRISFFKAFIVAVIVFVSGIYGIKERFGSINYLFDFTRLKPERFDRWATAIKIFKEHPVLGAGSSNFPVHFPDVDAHNIFLKLLSETGISGFLSFTLLFIYAFIKSLRRPYIAGSIVSIFIFSMFNPAPFFIRGVGCISWIVLHSGVFGKDRS